MKDRAASGVHFRRAFENFHSGDPLYFLSECVGSVQKQVPVKLQHLGGASRALDHRLFGRRQSTVERDHQRVPAKHDAHRFRLVAGPLLLERGCRLSNLLRHCFRGLCHRTHFWQSMPCSSKPVFLRTTKKNRRDRTRASGLNHVGLLCNRPPGEPGCLLFSRPTTCIYSSCGTYSPSAQLTHRRRVTG
jgi:hypothetical protein